MAIQKITVKGSESGSVPTIEADIAQYTLNTSQQFCALSIDFNQYPISFDDYAGIKYEKTGKLREQSTIFQQQIENSLQLDSWNFDTCPNPEIVIITNLREI